MAPGLDLALIRLLSRQPRPAAHGPLSHSQLGISSAPVWAVAGGEMSRLGEIPGSFQSEEETSLRLEGAHTWRLRPAV